jgi:Domain of unknown function (DUF4157)
MKTKLYGRSKATPDTAQHGVTMAGILQRKCSCGGRDDESIKGRQRNGLLRRSLSSGGSYDPEGIDIPDVVDEVLREPGRPLDTATRDFFEPRFGRDFSHVRVHTGSKAAQSAHSADALAYTVADQMVFGNGQFNPGTSGGRKLLAHELTHVVQLDKSGNQAGHGNLHALETEADHAESWIDSPGMTPSTPSTAAPALMRKNGAGSSQSSQPVAPTQRQATVIEAARSAAAIRSQVALFRVSGTVPPGPPGRPDPGDAMRRRAQALAKTMFEWDRPNMEQIEEIVSNMVSRLMNPQVMVAAPGDTECGSRAAYVRGLRPPIVLCPAFFNGTPEQRIRTIIHEAAHLARIGNAGLGESYCVIFDCTTSCGGFDAADSWAHFIHCLSGQAADQPTAIIGNPGGSGTRSGSGTTP